MGTRLSGMITRAAETVKVDEKRSCPPCRRHSAGASTRPDARTGIGRSATQRREHDEHRRKCHGGCEELARRDGTLPFHGWANYLTLSEILSTTVSARLFACFHFSQPAMGRVILILTAGFGDGHNTAARSVAEALTRLCPGEEIEYDDLISEAHASRSAVCKGALPAFAITHWPAAWRVTYDLMGKRSVTGPDSVWQAGLLNALKKRLETQKPRLIISTYPLYAVLLETLAETAARAAALHRHHRLHQREPHLGHVRQ
jgi:hypothetical protein